MAETLRKKKSAFKMPHIYVLLMAIISSCTILTWILPAGEFERHDNMIIRFAMNSGRPLQKSGIRYDRRHQGR